MSTAPTPPTPEPRRRGCLLPLLLVALFVSLLLNLGTVLVYFGAVDDPLDPDPNALDERFYLGDPDAKDKIAVVRVSGVLTDSTIRYPLRQLEAAARDRRVRAVVLRVNSPGGTVSASEELYQNVVNLRDDTGRRFKSTAVKPVHVSMGGLAASGGYYVSAAGKTISAERTTITGSIGVFVAIPNVAGLAREHGVKLELIKAGGMKASGSFFHELSPQERQTWQDTVDSAYDQFLAVIAANRPKLTPQHLGEGVVIRRMIPVRDDKGNPKTDPKGNPVETEYVRRLADGGTFNAVDAKTHGLVDRIEDLPATIRATAESVGVSSFRAVVYDQPVGWVERVIGFPLGKRATGRDPLADLSGTLTPRLWYLAPSADAGLFTEP